MGGPGSGTWFRDSKNTTNQYHAIDIRKLEKLQRDESGLLHWTRGGTPSGFIIYRTVEDELRLIYGYRYDDAWMTVEDTLYFDYSDCHFGGVRQWFSCPDCGQRVAVLYASSFTCRKCLNLAYESQRLNPVLRSLRQWEKTVEKLGGDRWTRDTPEKPKGMHWKTYYRLLGEAQRKNQLFGHMVGKGG